MPGTGSVIFQATTAEEADGYHFHDPIRIERAAGIDDVPRVLEAVEDASRSGCFAAGYVAYEAGAAFESAVPRRSIDVPYAWFGMYDRPERISRAAVDGLLSREAAPISHLRFSVPRPRYTRHVADIRELIHAGDVYQVNYTGQLRFDLEGPAAGLFRTLVERQPVPYAAYIDVGDAQIVSCSPELFFRRSGRRIVTRPMKGTAVRGRTAAEDDEIAARLAADAKNRAENLMIVDLLRNDLSRCCRPGTVRATRLFETERYETLIQMISEIEGELRPHAGLAEIFRAAFPCGSVTGAPKIRAMQRIDELEDEPRGVYCGAIGFVEPGGDAVFNVAIRTAVIRKGTGKLGIGSGIVWDSEADSEFEECMLKARFLSGDAALESEPFYLIETMRAEGGAIALLDLHLDRLARSAAYFGIDLDREAASVKIAAAAAARAEGAARVRATLDADGRLDVEAGPCYSRPEKWRVAVSDTRVDGADPLRRHKTSRRTLYNEKLAAAREAGFDEILFLNERGEVVEGSRSNVVVRRGRAWLTPPVESGALPGVYRRHLFESLPGLREEVLYINDVMDADAVYFCNAVLGLVKAEVARRPDLRTLQTDDSAFLEFPPTGASQDAPPAPKHHSA